MKQAIRDYLTFNKRERNGIFVLLIIIALLITYLNVSEYFIETPKVDFSKFEKEIDAFNALADLKKDSVLISEFSNRNEANNDNSLDNVITDQPEYFNFNPNNLSPENWQRLGFSDKQINVIKNYEAKGGRFRNKEDVKKMYCISSKQFERIEPYIQIPQEEKPIDNFEKNKIETKTPKAANPLVELNSADSAYLTKVKGIGPFYAKSIVKYRTQLGGFVNKEQLMEIWKFDQEKFDAIKELIFVDESEIKKININTCTASELKHPYVNWNVANAIVNYRAKHGLFKSIAEIKKTDLIDEETYRKIFPYLVLE